MIEMTYIDLILLVWAGLATAGYLHANSESTAAKKFIFNILDNQDLRDAMVERHERVMREMNE